VSRCNEHAEQNTGEEDHCLHESVGLVSTHVCCWCGDLFTIPRAKEHGKYEPPKKSTKGREKR